MITAPFFIRSIVDRLTARERQHVREEPQAYDTTSLPVDLAHRPGKLDPAKVRFVTVHVTDVTGGFGLAASARKRWERAVAAGTVPPELARQRPADASDGDWAYTLALLERYSHCPYHRLVSRRVGLVTNHPLTMRTAHGNGGNKGYGFAVDCGHGEELPPSLVATAREGLFDLILDAYEASDSDDEPIVVVPHRVFSKQRKVDTDKRVWQQIVLPALAAVDETGLGVARVGYEVVEGGYPIGTDWDPAALYDAKGRRL